MIRLYAFKWVPPFAQGLVRDLRVRWALEEAGLAHEVVLIGPDDQQGAPYRARQPFGQVPAYEEDGLRLFESGAIVQHIAERSSALMPADAAGRARVTQWLFAALNSIEPMIQQMTEIDLFHPEAAWGRERRPMVEQRADKRLAELAQRLDGRDWLEERFTAADVMMISVLRIPRHTDLIARHPVLEAYMKRGEARPAFQRALAAQMAPFAAAA